ncbi:TAXI family TRAP transporter solute-binding subunit [Halobacteriales archaeon Cl-PHB]
MATRLSRRKVLTALSTGATLSVAGCSNNNPSDSNNDGGTDSGDGTSDGSGSDGGGGSSTTIIGGFGNEGTTGFQVGQALARAFSQKSDMLDMDVRSTTGATHMRLLSNEEVDVGYLNGFSYEQAVKDQGQYADRPLETKAWQLHSTYAGNFLFIARSDANVETLSDMKGKRVNFGDPSGSYYQPIKLALEALDVYSEIEERPVGLPGGADAFANGRIDVTMVSTAASAVVPGYTQEVLQRAESVGYNFIHPSESEASTIDNVSGLVTTNMPIVEDIQRSSEPVYHINLPYMLAVRPGISDDLMYEYMSVAYNNRDLMAESAAIMNFWEKEQIFGLLNPDIPIHPGVAKFYDEQGWLTDEHTVGER